MSWHIELNGHYCPAESLSKEPIGGEFPTKAAATVGAKKRADYFSNLITLYSVVETKGAGMTDGYTDKERGEALIQKKPLLTTDKQARKEMPIARGVVDYFPLALAEVAHVSYVANEQHNPGQPMHWSKDKSADHADCIARHLIERGAVDDDGLRHSAKLAWRALANLEMELEEAAKGKA